MQLGGGTELQRALDVEREGPRGFGWADFQAGGNTVAAARFTRAMEDGRTRRDSRKRRSTGIRGKSGEPVRDALGELMEGFASPAGMAADLAVVEDQ